MTLVALSVIGLMWYAITVRYGIPEAKDISLTVMGVFGGYVSKSLFDNKNKTTHVESGGPTIVEASNQSDSQPPT